MGAVTRSLVPDMTVYRDGSIVVFTAVTPVAHAWVRDNVEMEAWQQLGPASFAVDRRLAHDLVVAMMNEGVMVRE